MSISEKKTLFLNGVFAFANGLVSLFVSVYLFVYTSSFIVMSVYTIFEAIGIMLGSLLAIKIFVSKKFTIPYASGLALMTGALIFDLCAGSLFTKNNYYVLIPGFIWGFGEGFFYYAYNACNQVVTTPQSRPLFLQFGGIINNICVLLSPLLSNFIITNSKTDIIGYRNILYVITFMHLVVISVSLTINEGSQDKGVSFSKLLNLKDEMWADEFKAVFAYGLMNSVYLTLTNLLVFDAAGNGGLYSKVQIFFSLCAIIAYRFLAKALKKENISKSFVFGYLLKISALLILVYVRNVYAAIYYGVVNAISNVYYDSSYSFISSLIVSKYEGEIVPRVAIREIPLGLGRTLGMILVVACYFIIPKYYLIVPSTILSLTPIITIYVFLKRYKKL